MTIIHIGTGSISVEFRFELVKGFTLHCNEVRLMKIRGSPDHVRIEVIANRFIVYHDIVSITDLIIMGYGATDAEFDLEKTDRARITCRRE